jgi:hypothetical protein
MTGYKDDPFRLEAVLDERDELLKEIRRLRKIEQAVKKFMRSERRAFTTTQIEKAIEGLIDQVEKISPNGTKRKKG